MHNILHNWHLENVFSIVKIITARSWTFTFPGKCSEVLYSCVSPIFMRKLTFNCIQLKNQNCINYSTASRGQQWQVLCYVIINASMAQCLRGDVHRYSGSSDISCFCGTHQRKPTTGCLISATSQVLPLYRMHVIQFVTSPQYICHMHCSSGTF
jgi:hypothetical protein